MGNFIPASSASETNSPDMTRHQYDRELGTITAQDREYAAEIIDDIKNPRDPEDASVEGIAQWVRKIRYEAVIHDRLHRPLTTAESK